MQSVYFWIEDREGKSSYLFWKTFLQQLFPYIKLESKRNNSELLKAVKSLDDTEAKYIIVFDNSFDNLQVTREYCILKKMIKKKPNIILLDIFCFEYILLEFKSLLDWIYAKEDPFRQKRDKAICARKELLEALSSGETAYKLLKAVVDYDKNIEKHNIEQFVATLLLELTRNTGFIVSKKNLGPCWRKDCCQWQERQEDDICGLDVERLSVKEKMNRIFRETSLQKCFKDAEMEVVE